MGEDRPLFILAGNGPYENRGCEAIVRGTVKIIKKIFPDPQFVCISDFQGSNFEKQKEQEFDKSIIHRKIKNSASKFEIEWWIQQTLSYFKKRERKYQVFSEMIPFLKNSKAVLSVGGDNYSLDYGFPDLFINLDDIVLEHGKPLVIWGASIGPFDSILKFETYMLDHLEKVNAIFAREPVTVEYLAQHNFVKNVFRVSDPAFVMDSIKPKNLEDQLIIDDGSIGINLSPLMARFVANGDIERWKRISANIISNIVKQTSRKVYLIPHVTIPYSNDFLFMKDVLQIIKPDIRAEINIVPPIYNASEIKWIISKMDIFAGARTHSTIAALSSCIPTLSFAYSIKAKGIARDIFGDEKYCLSTKDISAEEVSNTILSMLSQKHQIRNILKEKIPLVQKKAMIAGHYLKEVIDTNV